MARRRGKRGLRATISGRSGREWSIRIGLALGALVLGYFSTARSLANVLAKVDAESAYAIAPGNGVIAAKYAQEAFTTTPTMSAGSKPDDLARRALLADPTAVDALTVLGLQAQLRGEFTRADRIFSYSTALSRRELRPQIWAIERAVAQGDVSGAIRHYDIALRTSNSAAKDLFPTLIAALSEPRIRAELLQILATRPTWGDKFVRYAADNEINPEGVVALFHEGQQTGLDVSVDERSLLVNALISQGKFESAWEFYQSYRPGAQRNRSRDPNFVLQENRPAAFEWRVGDDARLGAAILRQGEGGLLDFSVPPSTGGLLARQMLLLPAGIYRLEGRSRGLEQPQSSRPYWTLICSDGRELGRLPVPNSDERAGRFAGQFTIGEGCKAQTLSLIARASDDIMGVSGQILQVRLVPLQSEQGKQ
ncbi:MAG: hypothetical protein CMH88_16065 [Oceanibulbus sp.]|nr:hypothetical protein [Sulfitobacter sp.]